MGFSSRELLLVLRARDEASRVVRSFATEFAAVDAAAMRASRNQIAAGSALVSVGAGIAGVGALGLAWMKGSIDKAVEFNREIARTSTQLDGVKASQQDLANVIKRTGRDIAVPIEQMQEGLYDIFSSMNVNLPQAEKLLRTFSKEAVAGQVDLREASRSTIGILNAFHLKVEDVTRVQDVQFQLVRKGVGTYEEFAKVMGRATPSAARAGQNIETLAGMLAYLTRNGLSAAMAAASAGRAFDAFSHPKTVNALEDLGVKAKTATGEFRPFTDVIKDLQVALSDMSAPERSAALYNLFKGSGGTIQARRFYDMVTKDAASVDQFVGLVGDMQNAHGAFEQAYGEMANTTATRSQLLKNNWELMRVEVGEALLPVFETLISILGKVLSWWNGLDEGLRKQIIIWGLVAAAIAVALGIMAALAGALMMLAGAAAAVGLTLMGLLGAFLAVIAGIALIAAAITFLATHWDAISKAFIAAWNAVWAVIKGIVDYVWQEIGQKLVALWNNMSNDIITALVSVRDWAVRVWTEIVQWAQTNWAMLKQIISPFVDWFVSIWPFISDVISAALNFIVDLFDSAWKIIVGVVRAAWILFSGIIEGIIQIFKGLIQFIVAVFTLNWEKMWDAIWMIFLGVWSIIKSFFIAIWEVIKAVAVAGLKMLVSLFVNGFKALVGLFSALFSTIYQIWLKLWNWVKDLALGIWDRIVKAAKNFAQMCRDAFQDAVAWVKLAWGKIVDVAKAPVNFVIEFVYNRGIRWLWNHIADFLGLGGLPKAKLLAGGGLVNGPGGPTDDLIPAITAGGQLLRLSDKEYIMPADKAAKYMPVLEAMRRGDIPGYAGGGPVVPHGKPLDPNGGGGGNGGFKKGGGKGTVKGGLWANILSFIGDVGKDIVSLVSDPIGFVTSKLGTAGKWIEMVAKLPFKILGKLGKWLWDKISGFMSVNPKILDAGKQKFLAAVTAFEGVDKTWIGPLGTLIQRESGWNPRAQNNSDINAKRGTPSKGLAQVIDPTFQAYRDPRLPNDIWNPMANVAAAIRYILARYGSIFNVQQAVGKVPRGYDSGGWMRKGWNWKGDDKPEAVLDPEQSRAFLEMASTGGPSQPLVQNFYITTQEIDPRKHSADLGWEIAHGGPAA
jgi:TP901 family phage tail tape measure protein